MSKIRVAVIVGGRSGEHEVSLRSGISVFNALDKSKYEVSLLGIDKSGRWILPDTKKLLESSRDPMKIKLESFEGRVTLPAGVKPGTVVSLDQNRPQENQKFDVVFPVLHGTYGEDGTIQGLFEIAGVPYVGSGVLGSAVCMDKDVAKRLLRDAGINVVPYLTFKKWQWNENQAAALKQIEKEIGYPFFVKPANLGSSVGVHKVIDRTKAIAAIDDALLFDSKILVEKAVSGRELECSVLGNDKPEASVVGEILPKGEFSSYEAKYLDDDGAALEFPAKNLSSAQVKEIQKTAIKAFQVLECRGMARVDFFLEKSTETLFVNELNTIPGFTSISMYPKLWEASGLPYPKLLDKLITLAIEENQSRKQLKTSFT